MGNVLCMAACAKSWRPLSPQILHSPISSSSKYFLFCVNTKDFLLPRERFLDNVQAPARYTILELIKRKTHAILTLITKHVLHRNVIYILKKCWIL